MAERSFVSWSVEERIMRAAAIAASALLLAGFVMALPASAADEVKTVSVEGEAAIIEGDPAQTEADVKRAARRNAVEQGGGIKVSSNTIVRNFALVSDDVASSATGMVTDEVWGPLTDGDTKTTKKIKLTAKVHPEAAAGAMCSILKANHDPKITLVFVEKIGDESKWSTERGMVEAMFTNAFKESCFTIVESGVKVTEVSANGDLPQAVIKEIVENTNAQYVALGSAKILKATNNDPNSLFAKTAMNSYGISANVKLVNTSNNEVEAVATHTISIPSVSPEKALELSDPADPKQHAASAAKNPSWMFVDRIMDQLFTKIAARWSSELVNANKIQVVLKNASNFAAAKAVKDLMAKTTGVDGVEQRDVRGGVANYDVTVDGGAEALAGKIEGKSAGKWTIEVVEVSRGKLVLKLKG